DLSPFLRCVEIVGSNLDRFACPSCGSTDRERHLRLYLDRLGLASAVNGSAILHIAPERWLPVWLSDRAPARYVKGDVSPTSDALRRLDLQALPFADGEFDFVICNHVLEHVDDVDAAAAEMFRVLKPRGRAICQTPFARRLTRTFEDPALRSAAERLFFYGQHDHLRLFGKDIEQRLLDAGFVGGLRTHAEILPDIDPELFGINEQEPFFDFTRPSSRESVPAEERSV
ncbi:MAG TPA: methyltransferase domain-containing protein, partial [Vicinamibacterales bacterium]